MPVPVARFSKSVAHPVNKDNYNFSNGQFKTIHNLTSTLPLSPVGPPPSFGTREEWINSLPTWRRTKPRRIWEDDTASIDQQSQRHFTQGLVDADNASAIKGAHAEACLPPSCDMFTIPSPDHGEADDEMSSGYSLSQYANTNGVTWEVPTGPLHFENHESYSFAGDMRYSPQQSYERGAFTPVFEDQSPDTASGPEPVSSPAEPVTPFGDFVDRAVAAAQDYDAVGFEDSNPIDLPIYECCDTGDRISFCQAPVVYPSIAEGPKGPAPSLEGSGANTGYKKLAEPLSIWVANYVWNVCTTGLSLPSMFSQPS